VKVARRSRNYRRNIVGNLTLVRGDIYLDVVSFEEALGKPTSELAVPGAHDERSLEPKA